MISGLVKIISIIAYPDGTVFTDFTYMTDVQAEENEFQTSAPCANFKKHFQFILTNYSITSPKMVSNNKPEG